MEIFDEFGQISGCILNYHKTKLYCNNRNITLLERFLHQHHLSVSPKPSNKNPTYLGVPLLKWDWTPKLTELVNRFKRIIFQDLTLTQRVLGVKTYIYSTLYFLDQYIFNYLISQKLLNNCFCNIFQYIPNK